MARKPRGRWAYLEDFRPTADGQYVYTGALYSFAEGDEALKKHRRSLWLLSAPVFAVILALGFLRIPGMVGCAYVLIPYAAELFCSGFTLWSLGSMTGKKLREYSYKRSVVRFPVFYPLTAILAAVCIVT